MADYGRFGTLNVEIKDAIAIVTLNRPEVLNAVDHQMHLEIEEVLETFPRTPASTPSFSLGREKPFLPAEISRR